MKNIVSQERREDHKLVNVNICFLVMVRTKITVASSDVVQAACMDISEEVPQVLDATQEVQRQVQLLELEQSELECSLLDESFFSKKGVVLQFVNNNCPGATSLIGGIRLGLDDVRKVPAYLEKNSNRLKHYAIKCLDRHIKVNQCCVGAGEKLTFDDYGISFSLATVSQRASMLNHSKRQEGQLFYCLFPGLLEPVFLGINPDGSDDFAHVFNVFIHLMPGSQRRNVFFRRMESDQYRDYTSSPVLPAHAASAPASTSTSPVNLPGKRHKSHSPAGQRRHFTPIPDHNSAKFDHRVAVLEKELQAVKGFQLPTPPLPVIAAPPLWRQDGAPTMPDTL
jgi:hypothetical protein